MPAPPSGICDLGFTNDDWGINAKARRREEREMQIVSRSHGSMFVCGEGIQQFVQVDNGDAGGDVAHRVGKDQVAGMDHSAAGVNDVWDITNFLSAGGNEYGFAGLADDLGGVVQVE